MAIYLADSQMGAPSLNPNRGNQTTESMTWDVDFSTGVSPPDGTVVVSQADFDALGAPLKYLQDVERIRPQFLRHRLFVDLAAGIHYRRPGTEPYYGGVTLAMSDLLAGPNAVHLDPTDLPLATPGILFRGAQTVLDASISVTIASSSTGTTITRSSGTWTPDQYKNKTVEVLSGAGSGAKVKIISHTATVLTCAGLISGSGAAVINIYEPASKVEAREDGGAFGFYTLKMGLFRGANLPIYFEDIQFSDSTNPAYMLLGANSLFVGCDIFGPVLANQDGAFLSLNSCYVDIPSALFNGIIIDTQGTMVGTIVNGAAGDNNLIWLFPGGNLGIEGCYFEPSASYAGDVIFGHHAVNLDFSQQRTTIQGISQNCVAIHVDEGTRVIDSQQCVVNDCAVVHQQDGGFGWTRGYLGNSNNGIVWKISKGADVKFDRTVHTAQGTTTFAEVDGQNFAETNLQNQGDNVTGQYGAKILAY